MSFVAAKLTAAAKPDYVKNAGAGIYDQEVVVDKDAGDQPHASIQSPAFNREARYACRARESHQCSFTKTPACCR